MGNKGYSSLNLFWCVYQLIYRYTIDTFNLIDPYGVFKMLYIKMELVNYLNQT